MNSVLKSSLAVFALTLIAASVANAQGVPEIDPSTGASGIALLAGAVMVVRGLRKR